MTLIPVVSVEVARIDELASEVRSHLQKSVESVVSAGRLLVAAKAELPHGSWAHFLEKAGVTVRTAQELMAVASHPVLGDPRTSSYLPNSLGALTALTRLPEGELEAALAAEQVTPDLTVRDARDLIRSAGRGPELEDDPDEGETSPDYDKADAPAPAPIRWAESRDEAVFSGTKGRYGDVLAVISRPGFKLSVPVAQDIIRALLPWEDTRAQLMQFLDDEVGMLISVPPYNEPRRIIPVTDSRDAAQVDGTEAFEARQGPHSGA